MTVQSIDIIQSYHAHGEEAVEELRDLAQQH